MTKKMYMKPEVEVNEVNYEQQLLTMSVKTTGLDGDKIQKDEDPGDAWEDAI